MLKRSFSIHAFNLPRDSASFSALRPPLERSTANRPAASSRPVPAASAGLALHPTSAWPGRNKRHRRVCFAAGLKVRRGHRDLLLRLVSAGDQPEQPHKTPVAAVRVGHRRLHHPERGIIPQLELPVRTHHLVRRGLVTRSRGLTAGQQQTYPDHTNEYPGPHAIHKSSPGLGRSRSRVRRRLWLCSSSGHVCSRITATASMRRGRYEPQFLARGF